jgi:hypothetical protein
MLVDYIVICVMNISINMSNHCECCNHVNNENVTNCCCGYFNDNTIHDETIDKFCDEKNCESYILTHICTPRIYDDGYNLYCGVCGEIYDFEPCFKIGNTIFHKPLPFDNSSFVTSSCECDCSENDHSCCQFEDELLQKIFCKTKK